ncbi:MAG: SDR family oxidoreductase [Acidimicrobiia bacterium]
MTPRHLDAVILQRTGLRTHGANVAKDTMRIAVTGATGYIGGRLVPQLEAAGHEVVCLARTPAKLDDRPWIGDVEVVQADVLHADELESALAGADAAYYLVHSMGEGTGFEDSDRRAALSFARACEAAGVGRVIYLGGLGSDDETLSPHLASRHDVGNALATTSVPVIEFRAAVIIGSGSVSFEMLRHLTQVLPAMTTPRWVRTRCQPIAIRDVLTYLVAALDVNATDHTIYEVGGPDVLTYENMMQTYASVAGLPRRLILPVPMLSPGLSSLWIGLVTPLPVNIARPLVDSLRHEVVVHDDLAAKRFGIPLLGFRESVELAVNVADRLRVPTRWTDAEASPAKPMHADPAWSGGTIFEDRRTARTEAAPEDVFWAFSRVGGTVGYYGFDWAWHLRGLLDSIIGGVGLRRGRRHPTEIRKGDAVDFWRVADVVPGDRLELAAEMKMPGDAWLVWDIERINGHSVLHQHALFRPRGLSGRLYWGALLSFHGPIFKGMLANIVTAAEKRSAARAPDQHDAI